MQTWVTMVDCGALRYGQHTHTADRARPALSSMTARYTIKLILQDTTKLYCIETVLDC
jgi:hypothetical protein